ncbi:MAG: TolC family protein, partial [Duncaniella sp.]|nr:TolC family protein [Duncaniella sp.]
DLVSVTLSVPLIDWGVRKGKVNMARNNLNVSRIAARQEELSIEEDIIMTVSDYEVRQRLITSASEALDLAETAYARTQQRFIIGKADINSITLSLNRRQEAAKNYISALQNYWLSHYKIRRLTLHDFELDIPLTESFEFKN